MGIRRLGAACKNCGVRPATIEWVGEGGALASVHGMGVPWCEVCATEAQLAHARHMASIIPELEQRLAELTK